MADSSMLGDTIGRPPFRGADLSTRSLLSRTRRSNPLPEGTLAVGAGLMVAGVTAWMFLVLAARVLGKEEYAPLSVLWVTVFFAGPGFFLPLEQEVTRALAGRSARGEGAGPLLRKAATLGALLAGMLVIGSAALSGLLLDHLFEGQTLLLIGLMLGMVGYCAEHLTKGTLSGLGRFQAYAVLLGAEGVARVGLCALLAAAGADAAGPYGAAVGLAPLVAVAVALRGQRGLLEPGPDAPWSELSAALGALLAGSVLSQGLMNIGPVAVRLLATTAEEDEVSRFLAGLIIARLPLFLFQAVQAALLPKLSRLASTGQFGDFRAGFRKLISVVAAIGAAAVVGALVAGPWAVRLLFGSEFDLSRRTLVMLAAASALYMLATALAQAVIALEGHAEMALSWLAGVVTFGVATALGGELFLRVEVGLLAGSAVAGVCLATVMLRRIRRGVSVTTDGVLEAIHDVHFEP